MASIFREQNLQRASTPDTLDDYIRIASPGVWMVLVVIILLLVAAVIWGIFGTVNVDATGTLVVNDDTATLWLGQRDAAELASGTEFQAADEKGMITSPAGAPEAISDVSETASGDHGELAAEGTWVCPFSASIDLPNGVYPATVVVQSYSPLELIFGANRTDVAVEGTYA